MVRWANIARGAEKVHSCGSEKKVFMWCVIFLRHGIFACLSEILIYRVCQYVCIILGCISMAVMVTWLPYWGNLAFFMYASAAFNSYKVTENSWYQLRYPYCPAPRSWIICTACKRWRLGELGGACAMLIRGSFQGGLTDVAKSEARCRQETFFFRLCFSMGIATSRSWYLGLPGWGQRRWWSDSTEL